jgi:hypothetical protein
MNRFQRPPFFKTLTPLAFLVATASSGFGQATSGTLSGFVTDATGAAVPNAQVTITDIDRGTTFSVTSGGDGLFSRSQLPNGRYQVSISAQGFKTTQQNDVTVNVDRDTRVNFTLQTGSTQDAVTVSADSVPVLNTDRAEISTTIEGTQLRQYPTLGQNVTSLELLSPGTVPNSYSIAGQENPQNGLANNTNGLLFGFSNRQIDGADDMDSVLGIQVLNPPPDSLEEMKVTTSNYDAEFGRAGGSFVQYATKSGTNSLHGDLFEYFRNNFLDARNPYTESSVNNQRQQPLHFNQFGGSIGGKIIKDKLFFFGTYQGQRQSIGSAFVENVPTAAERTGNLSAIGGPVLPTGAISPVATNLLNLIPLPNAGTVNGVGRYIGSGTVQFNTNQYDSRVDWVMNDKNRIFFRYDGFFSNINSPAIFGNIAGGPSVDPAYGPGISTGANHNGSASYNHVFSPTLLMNLRYSYYRYQINVLPTDYGTNTATAVGIPGINLGTLATSGLSNFVFNGTALSGQSVPGYASSSFQFGTTIGTNAPLNELEQLHQLSPVFTKQLGNHEIKFGGDYRWIVNYRSSSDYSQRGTFGFNSNVATPYGTTTDAFESFLLGMPSSFQRFDFTGNPKEYEQDVFGYVQDRWRVTPKLTISYGLRYELYTAPYANQGNGANFNLNTGQLMVAGYGNVNSATNINTRTNNFAPRLGVAYSLTPKTIIRAGYGRSYFPDFYDIQISHNYPVDFTQSINAPTGQSLPFNLSQGPPIPTSPVVPANGLLPLPAGVSPTAIPTNRKTSYVDAFNLTIQQQIGNSASLQIAYVGNQARHLMDFYNANTPLPGPGNSLYNSPYYSQFGYTQPITVFANDLSSNYNSLQVSFDKRVTSWYSITTNYTWSKALNYGDDSREYGLYNLSSQYGPTGFNRTNAFKLGHVVDLPFGPGKLFFKNMSPVQRNLFAGWQFTGVTTAYSGTPYTPIYSNNVSLNANGTIALRGFQIGDPTANVPAGLAFNPNAYVPSSVVSTSPAYLYQQGNAGRNSLVGPAFFEADLQLSKSFNITEHQTMQFAWQNFNAFNHVNKGTPVNDLSSAQVGQYTSLAPTAMPRTMQFSLRYSF